MNAEELCNELARALLAADENRKRHIIAALVTKNGRALVNELLYTLKQNVVQENGQANREGAESTT